MAVRRSGGLLGRLVVLLLALVATPATAGPAAAETAGPPSFRSTAGDRVPDGRYPFMAAVLNESFGADDYFRQYCGGTLVDPEWVLTAAHCVAGVKVSDLAVTVGRTVLTSTAGDRREVADAVVHPDFGEPTEPAHDVALLRLAAPVEDVTPIEPAGASDDSYEADGTELTVIGWGNTRTSGRPRFPDRLRETTVPVVGDEDCAEAYRNRFDAATMLCAGGGGYDSCQGDSGGPLLATRSDGSAVQLGIVSWGLRCGLREYPGVYTEVNNPAIHGWITRTIRPD